MSAPGSHISFSPRQVGGDFSPIEPDDNKDCHQQPPLRPPLREGERGAFAFARDEDGTHHQSEELFRLPESLHPAPSPTTYNCSSGDTTGSSESYGRYCASPTASVTVADFDNNAALSPRHHRRGGRKSLINERQTDHFVFLPTGVPADPWADLTAADGDSSPRDGARSQSQPDEDETEHHQATVAVAVPSDSINDGDASASSSSSLLPLTRLCLALWHLILCAVITAGSLYFILRVWRPSSASGGGEDALFKFLFYCAAFWPAVLSAVGVLMLLGPAAVNRICSGGSSTSTSDAEEKTEGSERVATTTAPPLCISPAACSFATATAAALLTLFYGGGLLLTVGFASYFLSGGAWGLFILLAFAVPIMMTVVLVHLPLVASAHRQVGGGSGCRCCCCCGLAPIALAAE